MASTGSIVYLNGAFLPRQDAKLDIEDRGALFADGVYEVIRYYRGRAFELQAHVERLRHSLDAVRIHRPDEFERLAALSDELVKRNAVPEAKVYWQITRGAAPRDHVFKADGGPKPTVLMLAYSADPVPANAPPKLFKTILHADERWSHCWIKSLMLLPNVLARTKASEAGAQEAILHRDGRVTECTASSLFIAKHGELITHPADQWVLGSITRHVLIDEARAVGIRVYERVFTVDELLAADEAIIAGTTVHVCAVTHVDGVERFGGRAGPLATRLQSLLMSRIDRTCPRP